jgi:hypothetical protein
MVPVSAFFSRLLPNVIGCPEPLAQQALVDSAIHFCETTLAITVDLDPQNVLVGVRDYELDLPTQQELAQVVRVWLDDRLLSPVPSYEVASIESIDGRPRYYFSRDIDEVLTIRLFPTPDKEYLAGLAVRVATRPTRNAAQVHNALFNEWSEVIVDGALARLHDIPGQSFSNEAKSMMLYQKVRNRMNSARVTSLHGRTVSSMSVTMRAF